MTHYDEKFYDSQYEGSIRSAKRILSRLFQEFKPTSIIDFGCGVGSWLYAAEQLGVDELLGLDGPWVKEEQLLTDKIAFEAVDFERLDAVNHSCDLAVSVEVAEHFDRVYANRFISLITGTSDLIVFGAAIPLQGGQHHVNERPQSYWVDMFSSKGFVCFDYFRPALWNDAAVEFWYRQNTLLFVRQSELPRFPFLAAMPRDFIVDVVHPELLAKKNRLHLQRADLLREAALLLESENLEMAFLLMAKAAEARPKGAFIREKLRAYAEALGKA